MSKVFIIKLDFIIIMTIISSSNDSNSRSLYIIGWVVESSRYETLNRGFVLFGVPVFFNELVLPADSYSIFNPASVWSVLTELVERRLAYCRTEIFAINWLLCNDLFRRTWN